jgi:hypothetical protein
MAIPYGLVAFFLLTPGRREAPAVPRGRGRARAAPAVLSGPAPPRPPGASKRPSSIFHITYVNGCFLFSMGLLYGREGRRTAKNPRVTAPGRPAPVVRRPERGAPAGQSTPAAQRARAAARRVQRDPGRGQAGRAEPSVVESFRRRLVYFISDFTYKNTKRRLTDSTAHG